MIAHLKGIIIQKLPGQVIIETSGVGYKVRISHHTHELLPEKNKAAILHIYHHISENDQQLFGFFSTEEQHLFELLITVKGIGPRIALALLSSMSPESLVQAIIQSNATLISNSPGVGKKTAERIVLELKDKLNDIPFITNEISGDNSKQRQTLAALEALGYSKNIAANHVNKVFNENSTASVPELVKRTLRLLQNP